MAFVPSNGCTVTSWNVASCHRENEDRPLSASECLSVFCLHVFTPRSGSGISLNGTKRLILQRLPGVKTLCTSMHEYRLIRWSLWEEVLPGQIQSLPNFSRPTDPFLPRVMLEAVDHTRTTEVRPCTAGMSYPRQ